MFFCQSNPGEINLTLFSGQSRPRRDWLWTSTELDKLLLFQTIPIPWSSLSSRSSATYENTHIVSWFSRETPFRLVFVHRPRLLNWNILLCIHVPLLTWPKFPMKMNSFLGEAYTKGTRSREGCKAKPQGGQVAKAITVYTLVYYWSYIFPGNY